LQLQQLSASTSGAQLEGDGTVEVHGITHDSRNVKPGDLFVCLVGAAFDGHRFAGDAVAHGAVALVALADHAGSRLGGVPVLIVPDTREALSDLAATIYDHPSRSMRLAGVTGTNGKTTTTALTASILRSAGLQTGTIGTRASCAM